MGPSFFQQPQKRLHCSFLTNSNSYRHNLYENNYVSSLYNSYYKARIWRPAAGKCRPKIPSYLSSCFWPAGNCRSTNFTSVIQITINFTYRLRVNLLQNQRRSFQFHYGSHVCHVCKQNAHGAV